ncbi:MAG: GGDEF domain-containing protein, partial [Gammaproteobacteria bacterium]
GSYNQNRFVRNMATDFVEHMASVVSICLENNLNFEDLKRTGLTDTLTGVNNRRFLEQRLGEEICQCQRRMEPLSCFFLDIDHFKSVNDTYGHQAGDLVLRLVAGAIKDQMRNNDIVARYGGEEFVALLSSIDESLGTEIAERIRKKVKSLAIEYKDCKIRVTISIGFACYAPQVDSPVVTEQIASALIHSADNALYLAKNKGRDCVVSNGAIPLLAKKADAG